jgi:hypothetical protein
MEQTQWSGLCYLAAAVCFWWWWVLGIMDRTKDDDDLQ